MLHIPSLGLRTAQPIDLQTGQPTSMQYTSMRYGMAFVFIGMLNVRSSKMKDYVLVTPCFLFVSLSRSGRRRFAGGCKSNFFS